MRKLYLFGAILCLGAFVLWQGQAAAGNEEEPDYSTVERNGDLEIRDYPQLIAAEVSVPSNARSSENEAFKILAGYIFGGNREKTKIAMTVPVIEQVQSIELVASSPALSTQSADGSMRMRFFMPSKFTMATLPVPSDERIRLTEVSPQKYAVIRFSGAAGVASVRKHTALLMKFVADRKLTASGECLTAFYNPPWTLPFLRRNEVWIPLRN